MKPYINFLIFILAAVAFGYTAYGMVMFQEDEPKPFVFSEPKLRPEFLLMDEANANTADAQQKTLAVEEAQKALGYYREQQQKAPQQANDTIALLVDRMINSDLPLYFVSGTNDQNGNKRSFETLHINSASIIDLLGEALGCATASRIHTFIATSPIHMKNKLRMSPEQVIAQAVKAIKWASAYTDNIEFSPEGAGRSEIDLLCRVLEAVISAGAKTLNIPDTVGYTMPEQFGQLIRTLANAFQTLT